MTTCNRRWIIHRVVLCIIRGDDIITATRSSMRENDAHNNCVLCPVWAELESILLQFFPRFGSFCPQHYLIDAAVKHLFPFRSMKNDERTEALPLNQWWTYAIRCFENIVHLLHALWRSLKFGFHQLGGTRYSEYGSEYKKNNMMDEFGLLDFSSDAFNFPDIIRIYFIFFLSIPYFHSVPLHYNNTHSHDIGRVQYAQSWLLLSVSIWLMEPLVALVALVFYFSIATTTAATAVAHNRYSSDFVGRYFAWKRCLRSSNFFYSLATDICLESIRSKELAK